MLAAILWQLDSSSSSSICYVAVAHHHHLAGPHADVADIGATIVTTVVVIVFAVTQQLLKMERWEKGKTVAF